MDVLKAMEQNRVSAVAIISSGSSRHLIGNFSLSDIRGLTDNDVSLLMLPVEDFLRQRSPASMRVISCTKSSTVGTIIETLADEKLHRLWVVDLDLFPVGLVSLTDVMNLVLNFSPKRQAHILSIPGVLQVSILGVRNLTSGSWLSKPFVVVQIPGIKQAQFVTPTSDSINEASWVGQTFMVEIDEPIAQDMLLFMVKGQKFYGRDEDLGYLTVAFSWVLSGFGSGVHCLKVQDWFSLKNRDSGQLTLGQIQLSFKYSPVVPAA